MVWTGISINFRTYVVLNANEYRDHIFVPIVRPRAKQIGENMFMHDNARPNIARLEYHCAHLKYAGGMCF